MRLKDGDINKRDGALLVDVYTVFVIIHYLLKVLPFLYIVAAWVSTWTIKIKPDRAALRIYGFMSNKSGILCEIERID